MQQRYTIEEIRKRVIPIAARYGVGKLTLFGSYARGDCTLDSDIDILVRDKGRLHGLEYFCMAEDIAEVFDCKVDCVFPEKTTLQGKFFYANVEKEEIPLYDEC